MSAQHQAADSGTGFRALQPGPAPHRRSMGVRFRLMVLVVGSGLLILGLFGMITFRIAEDVALQEMRARARALADSTALQLDERLAQLAQSARTAAALGAALRPSDAGDTDVLRRALRSIAERELVFLSIYVFYDRQVIPERDYAAVWETRNETEAGFTSHPYYPNLPGEPDYDPARPVYDYYRQNPRFAAARDAAAFAWTDLFRDVGGRPGNVYVMSAVAPMLDSTGRFLGVAGVDLQFGRLQTFVEGVKPTPNSYAILVDQRGTLVAHGREPTLSTLNKSIAALAAESGNPAFGQLGEQMLVGKTGIMELADPLNGEATFAVYAPVEEVGWSIGMFIPLSDLVGGVNDLRNSILGLTAIALVVLGGLGLFLGDTIVRPLVRLTRTARQVAAGDLQQVAVVERRDETGALAETFNAMTARLRELIGSLEAQVEARTEQLRVSADVGRAAASILDPDHLLRETVNLITDRFGFYYAAVFTLDEAGRYAVLREATGQAGQTLKQRGHRLEVGGQSMVGYATAQRKPRIALDVGQEAVRFANPLLPDTRSEIALPLLAGDRVLGALDVQSTQEAAFDETSAAVLQNMADQIAIALNTAALFTESQRNVQTLNQLLEMSRDLAASRTLQDLTRRARTHLEALLEVETYYLALVDEGQTEIRFVFQRRSDGSVEDEMVAQPFGTGPGLAEHVIRMRQTLRFSASEAPARLANLGVGTAPFQPRAFLGVPILSGPRVLGVLGLQDFEPDAAFDDAHEQLALALANQLGVMLDNLRLVEQTQRALADLDMANRVLTGQAWQRFTRAASVLSGEWRGGDWVTIREDDGGARDDGLALISDHPSPTAGLKIPLKVRGETVGEFRLESDGADRAWTAEDIAFAQALVDQVGQTLETVRLLEETERLAGRERLINEINRRVRQTVNIDSILQTAVGELGRTLGAARVFARIAPSAEDTSDGQAQTAGSQVGTDASGVSRWESLP